MLSYRQLKLFWHETEFECGIHEDLALVCVKNFPDSQENAYSMICQRKTLHEELSIRHMLFT